MTVELITSLLQFEEPAGALSVDACGGLDDLFAPAGYAWPAKERGVIGLSAVFDGAAAVMQAQDLRLDGTLHTRDLTIAAVLRWNFDAQHAAGDIGTVVSRGLGTAGDEYQAFGLELVVKDFATRTGTVRITWQDLAGVRRVQTGADFFAPPNTEYMLVTATRRWITANEVAIDYYIGRQLLATVSGAHANIGGGVDGTTSIGARYTGAAFDAFFAGAIDELAFANYVMSQEEVEALWARLSDHQPDGYRLIREMLPPGLPITDDPDSEAQIDLRLIGAALGFASAQTENMRDNMQPDRAYGEQLRRWEKITEKPSRVGDSIAKRRARVVGQIRMRAGVSVPGVEVALADLLDCDLADVEVIAFDQTIRDTFAALEPERWNFTPLSAFTALNPDLRVQLAAGDYTWPGWGNVGANAIMTVERSAAAQMIAKLTPTTIPANGEAGIWLYSFRTRSALFFGMRNVAGVYTLGHEIFTAGAAGGFVAMATPGLVPVWLRIRMSTGYSFHSTAGAVDFDLSWTTIGPDLEANFTTAVVTWIRGFEWAGMYARSSAAIAGALDVKFGEVAVRVASGTRPYYWYVFRDPGLGGAPDLLGAQQVVRRMRHANTYVAVITSRSLLCDSLDTLTDSGPMGAL